MGDMDEVPEEEEARLPAGTRLGKYEILRLLGAGGMGAVYEAAHVEIGKHVAIKVLGPAVAAIPGARARFLREAQLTTRVRHPNIVDVTDMGNENGQTYLVMELLRGEDLARRLSRTGPLSTREIADIMLPVCAAVVAAHQAGITHRDLKPQNIFLAVSQNSVQPKVLDFGISKGTDTGSAGTLTGTGAMIGTPFYLAPEQILDNRSAGPASDQYALGVILYETLTGHRPFDAENLFVVLQAIVAGSPRRPRERRPEISVEMEEVVVRAMHLNPRMRFQTTEELGRALLRFASERERLIWEEAFRDSRLDTRPLPPVMDETPPPRQATTTPLPPSLGLTTPLPPASLPRSASGSGDWAKAATPRSPSSVSGTRVMKAGLLEPASEALPIDAAAAFDLLGDGRAGSKRGRNLLIAGLLGTAGVVAVLVLWPGGLSTDRGGKPESGNHGATSLPGDPSSPNRRPLVEPPTFRVSLTTEPDNAIVELDGTVVGSGSIERKMLLDHVPHTLRVSADGFDPRTVEFTDTPPPSRIMLARHVATPVSDDGAGTTASAGGTTSAATATTASAEPRPGKRRRSKSGRGLSSGSGRAASDSRPSAPPDSDAPRGLNPNGAPIID
jgi:serine/threonine-protein kinase